MIRFLRVGTLLLLGLLMAPPQIPAASEPFGIDVQELDRQKPPAAGKPEKKKVPKEKKPASSKTAKPRRTEEESGYIRYTVKPGDHIFKILVGRLGMSNDAAERLIPEIIRINDISNIKTLQVGSTLLIPKKLREHGEQAAGKETPRKKRGEAEETASESAAKREARAAKCPPAAKPAIQAARPAPSAPAPQALPPAPSAATPKAPPPSAPAPSATISRAPGAPVPPPAPAIPSGPLWICPVTDMDTAKEVDSLLNALSITYTRNRIIHSGGGAATAFSIRVERYFEYQGGKFIVSIGENDPYTYTLTRLLETAGYHVLMLDAQEKFEGVGEKLLKLVGVTPNLGSHPLPGGKEMTGFLVRPEDAAGREVLLTSQPADKRDQWVMKPGCLEK